MVASIQAAEPQNPLLGWKDPEVVREMRIGRGASPEGAIRDAWRTRVLQRTDEVHLSLELAPRFTGNDVELLVIDAADDQELRRDRRAVPIDGKYVHFYYEAGELPVGSYRAVFRLDEREIARASFDVRGG
jgi:hypothetical protein